MRKPRNSDRRLTGAPKIVSSVKQLFDAIESRMVDKDDAAAKERIAGLKALRDQSTANAERTQATLDSAGSQSISLAMIDDSSRTAR